MLRKQQLLALLLGACLACACFTQVVHADDDDYDDDEGDAAAPAGDDLEKDVVVLTDSTFDDTISKAKFALVEFYAPWCGHCKNLVPEYAKAATALKAYDASIVIAKLDATEEKDSAAKFEVSGYPTIKWFVNGEASDYSGGRTADDIIRWVKKKTGPPAATVDEVSKLKDLEGDNEVLVLGYFKAFEGADFDAFVATAQVAEDVEYIQTTDSAVAEKAGLTKPGVVVIKNFPGEARETAVYSGKLVKKDLEEFVKGEKIPLVFPFSQQTSSKIFGAGIPKHILFVGKESQVDPESSDMKMLRKVAFKYKGKLVFVSVNADDASGSPVIDFFGVDKEGKMPQVVGFYMEKRQKFRLEKKVDEKHLDEFAKAVVEDKATPIYKSAPIPKEATEDDVVVVVGKNFDQIVKDSKKDVLLEVYAPWCGHCKTLAPIYAKLAKRFKTVDSVVIAKMDGTENEVPDLEVSGYPTIKFFPAGGEVMDYDGARDLKGFTKFLKKNAKVPFELPKKKKASATEEQKDDSHDEL